MTNQQCVLEENVKDLYILSEVVIVSLIPFFYLHNEFREGAILDGMLI